MSYDKRTIERGPAVFLRECEAFGIAFRVVNGRIVTDAHGDVLQAYIQAHHDELLKLLEVENVTR